MHHQKDWIVINGVRLKAPEIIGYRHYYRAANPEGRFEFEKKEDSYIEVFFGRNVIEVQPTDQIHTDQILAILDKHCGVPA